MHNKDDITWISSQFIINMSFIEYLTILKLNNYTITICNYKVKIIKVFL